MSSTLTLLLLAFSCGVSAGTATRDVDPQDLLALGQPLGAISFAPALPVAICSPGEGEEGFLVVTERPAMIRRIGGDGAFLGDPQRLPALFPRPRGILPLLRGHFLVVDRDGALGEIDGKGRLVRTLPGPPPPWRAGALCHDWMGTGYLVTDLLRGEVHHLDADGGVLRSWSGFTEPVGIATLGDEIWVSDAGIHRLIRWDQQRTTPQVENGIGDHGAAPGLLAAPMGMCRAGARFLLVADRDNHRVQLFSSRGISMHHWGIHSMLPREARGRLHYPVAVAYDEKSKVCALLEPSERRLQRFGLRDPEVPVSAADLWQRVDLVSHYGAYWALQPQGPLLVISEPDSERISILVRDREAPFEVDDVGGPGFLPARFRNPVGIDFMPAAAGPRVVVADRGNRRLQMFEVRWQEVEPLRREPDLAKLVRTVDLELLAATEAGWSSPVPPRLSALACNDDGIIAVSDDANERILLLDGRFQPMGVFRAEGLFRAASAISADRSGFLVADATTGNLLRFTPGDDTPQLISTGSRMPVGVDRHPDGSIWFTNAANHSLLRIPPGGGEPQEILAGAGTGSQQLFRPRAVRIDESGEVWVLDHGNHRGVVISPDGEVRHFGSEPYLPGGTKAAGRRKDSR